MRNLDQLKTQLRERLPKEGISAIIKSLKEVLPESASKRKLLLQLEADYKSLKIKIIEGIISDQDVTLETNKVRSRLFDFIESLEAADFDRQTKRSQFSADQKVKRGHVLYIIPKRMQLNKDTHCLIRIAFEKAQLVEDLDLDEDTQFRLNVRISDYMKVEIVDPATNPAFKIRCISEAVQFIDEDESTEWRFTVRPLVSGEHLLLLKVTIMPVIDGEARVRERTLEESVVIVAGPIPEEKVELKEMEESFEIAQSLDSFIPKKGLTGIRKVAQPLAVLLLFIISFSATYAFVPPFRNEIDWQVTDTFYQNKEAYAKYIEKHPESRRKEKATFRKAEVQENPGAYQEYFEKYDTVGKFAGEATWNVAKLTGVPEVYRLYLERYENGPFVDEAKEKLKTIEPKLWEVVLEKRNFPELMRYLELFPEKRNTEAVGKLLRDEKIWNQGLGDYQSFQGAEKLKGELPGLGIEETKKIG